MAHSVGGVVQASNLLTMGASVLKYTANRNDLPCESAKEAQEHAGEFVARSFDGRKTLVYARSIDDLRAALANMGFRFADVVVEFVEGDVIDVDAGR